MSKTDKQPDRGGNPPPELPVKTGVTLSAAASRKLRAAAVHEGKTQSELVEALVLKHLGGYFTSNRAKGESGQTEAPTQDTPAPGLPTG